MTTDKSIFGLRFGSNVELQPTQIELDHFLKSPKKAGGKELHGGDLAAYTGMLDHVAGFESGRLHDVASRNFQDRILYGALSHSSFFTVALKAAVEHYKYQLQALLSLDFRKATTFIASAEQEMAKLNPKKKPDSDKISRLQALVEERKKALETLERRRAALVRELNHIVQYVKENLIKITGHCETAIVLLVQLQTEGTAENRLIEGIKASLKQDLKDKLQQGTVTKEDLETAKRDMGALSEEMAILLREDVYALTSVYEAVYDRTKAAARDLDGLLPRTAGARTADVETERKLYSRVEEALLALVSGLEFKMKAAEIRSRNQYRDLLEEKRAEMLDSFFQKLKTERRGEDRRNGQERRTGPDPGYDGEERRSGSDRRSGEDRRKP